MANKLMMMMMMSGVIWASNNTNDINMQH